MSKGHCFSTVVSLNGLRDRCSVVIGTQSRCIDPVRDEIALGVMEEHLKDDSTAGAVIIPLRSDLKTIDAPSDRPPYNG
ncbi:hypothetical protein EVAR_62754_1 [Eumeta japonica]|uniref:Uncharacterized protein n=1 Tax=Eumeta variegata TaxID=151549 RepID=A0A4C1Z782_EUMVA|nr:hypothetical protein EVAR_62754_1 [Eumeta japonica]